jgi:hypothetical protein
MQNPMGLLAASFCVELHHLPNVEEEYSVDVVLSMRVFAESNSR